MIKTKLPDKILYLCLTGFFLKFATTFSIILSTASFLKMAGASQLPTFYIILNIMSITVGTTLAVTNVKNFRVPIYASAAVGLCVIGFSFLLNSAGAWEAIILYTFVAIYDIYANILFWTYINQCLTIKEMKAYVGTISGISFFGGILVGFLNKALLSYISISAAYVVCGTIHLLLPLVTIFHVETPASKDKFLQSGFMKIMKEQFTSSKLLRIIMLIFAFSSFIRYTVGFQFGLAISEYFRDEKALAGFIGLFDSAVKIVIFLSQMLAANRLLKNFSLMHNLLFYQMGVVIFSIILIFQKSLWMVIAFQFYFQIFVKLVEHNVANTLFNVFAQNIKNQIKFMVEGTVFPLTSIFVGIFITTFKVFFSTGPFFILLAAVGFLYYLSTRDLNEAYMETIAENLKAGSVTAGIPDEKHDTHAESFDLDLYLANERGGKLDMVSELDKLSPEMASGIVMRLLRDEKDKFVVASIVKIASRIKSEKIQDQLGKTISTLKDPRVTANFIESMFRAGDPVFVSRIIPHLEHENNRVRANAILGTIKLSSNEDDLKKALYSLNSMLRSDSYKHRASAAATIGEIGLECFSGALTGLLADRDISVRKAALAACEKTGSQKLLPSLKAARRAPENSSLAVLIDRAVSRMETNIFERLLTALKAYPDSEKRYITEAVRKIKKAETVELILMVLNSNSGGFSIRLAGLIAEYPCESELLKMAGELIHKKAFPAKQFLEEIIFNGKSFAWEKELLSALASDLRGSLREGLVELIADTRSNEAPSAILRKYFEILGYYLNDRERAGSIYESIASPDAVRSDLALELLESVKEDDLKSGYIKLCKNSKKT